MTPAYEIDLGPLAGPLRMGADEALPGPLRSTVSNSVHLYNMAHASEVRPLPHGLIWFAHTQDDYVPCPIDGIEFES